MKQSKETKKIVKKAISGSLNVDVLDLKGKVVEKIALPKEIFASKENPELVAQAVRVYLANKRQGTSSTKSRGEINATTKKVWRQKGTGRARHGAESAPIFVGGGVAFGPKPREHRLSLTKSMRHAALFSVLSTRNKEQTVMVVSGFEQVEPKTKNAVLAFKSLALDPGKKSVLIVTGGKTENVLRAAKNVEGVELVSAASLNAYIALKATTLLFMKESIDLLAQTFVTKEKK